jgi:hypothetical protein
MTASQIACPEWCKGNSETDAVHSLAPLRYSVFVIYRLQRFLL